MACKNFLVPILQYCAFLHRGIKHNACSPLISHSAALAHLGGQLWASGQLWDLHLMCFPLPPCRSCTKKLIPYWFTLAPRVTPDPSASKEVFLLFGINLTAPKTLMTFFSPLSPCTFQGIKTHLGFWYLFSESYRFQVEKKKKKRNFFLEKCTLIIHVNVIMLSSLLPTSSNTKGKGTTDNNYDWRLLACLLIFSLN